MLSKSLLCLLAFITCPARCDLSSDANAANAILTTRNNFILTSEIDSLIKSTRTVIIFYGAAWCSNTKRFTPKYLQVVEREALSHPDSSQLSIRKVVCEVKRGEDLGCANYNVNGYPTVNLYQNGKYVEEYPGAHDATELIAYIEEKSPRKVKRNVDSDLVAAGEAGAAALEVAGVNAVKADRKIKKGKKIGKAKESPEEGVPDKHRFSGQTILNTPSFQLNQTKETAKAHKIKAKAEKIKTKAEKIKAKAEKLKAKAEKINTKAVKVPVKAEVKHDTAPTVSATTVLLFGGVVCMGMALYVVSLKSRREYQPIALIV